jgi:hypothetical protein
MITKIIKILRFCHFLWRKSRIYQKRLKTQKICQKMLFWRNISMTIKSLIVIQQTTLQNYKH